MCPRVASEEPGSQHDRRVRSVGTRGNGGNRDGPVTQFKIDPLRIHTDGATGRLSGEVVLQIAVKLFFRAAEFNTVLWATWSRDAGNNRGEIEHHKFAVARLNCGVVPQPLLFGVRLNKSNLLDGATGQAQVVQSDLVNGEHRRCGTKFRAHVSNGCAVRQGNLGDP